MMRVEQFKQRLEKTIKQYLHQGGKVKLSIAVLSSITLFGLHSLSLGTMAGKTAIMKMLHGLSREIAPSVLVDLLQRWTRDCKEPTLDDAIDAAASLSQQEQELLSLLTEHLGVWEMVLQEALRQQRMDLLAQFQETLQAWGPKLNDATREALLQALSEHTKSLQQGQQQIKNEIDGLKHLAGSADGRLQQQEVKISSIQQQLALMMSLMQTLNRYEVQHHADIAGVHASVQAVHGAVAQLQSQIASLQHDIQQIKSQPHGFPDILPRRRRRLGEELREKLWDSFNDEWNDAFDA